MTDNIEIEVKTKYLQEHSDPDASRFAFAYTIEITNRGPESVTLMGRHWHITDANDQVEEVIGEGVVGQQPEIGPGQSFNYTSGAVLETEFGTMHGSYDMLTAAGRKFKTEIPAFLLSLPRTVH